MSGPLIRTRDQEMGFRTTSPTGSPMIGTPVDGQGTCCRLLPLNRHSFLMQRQGDQAAALRLFPNCQPQSVRSAFTMACASRSRPAGDGWMSQVRGEDTTTMRNPAAHVSPPKAVEAAANAPNPSATIPPQANVRTATN